MREVADSPTHVLQAEQANPTRSGPGVITLSLHIRPLHSQALWEFCAGLNALACARAHGASRIVITDIREDNLPLAERLGAWKALHTPAMSPAEAAGQLTALLPPYGPDTVIDCVGHETTTQAGLSRGKAHNHLSGCLLVVLLLNSIASLVSSASLESRLQVHEDFRLDDEQAQKDRPLPHTRS